MGGQAFDRVATEQVGAILEVEFQLAVLLLDHGQGEVELGDRIIELVGAEFDAAIGRRRCIRGQRGEHRVEQRAAAEIARRCDAIDEIFELTVLVLECVEALVANLLQVVAESELAARPAAQRQGIDEQADHALEPLGVAARCERADHQVVLAGIFREHDVVGGEQQHVHRHAVARREFAQRGAEPRIGTKPHPVAVKRLRARPREVGRQIQRRPLAREQAEPIVLLLPGRLAAGEVALPEREILVVGRQRRQRLAVVEPAEFVAQDVDRHAVADDVVQIEQKHVLERAQPDQTGPQQRRAIEIERPDETPLDRFDLALAARPLDIERDAERRLTRLDDRLVSDPERRPQAVMARHQRRQRVLQPGRVELAVQPDRDRHVVGDTVRRQPVEDIHPPLVRGRGKVALLNRRRHLGAPFAPVSRPAAPIPPRSAHRTRS
ncbi:hypothetical protein HNR60_001417 [Rhodopseudomonas rhenobacensis]|uniref:Uncharacterized protein n=1 Tax=Rhodopseudomonas rhenobacensis TaxID=87461 RepID=A0A7W8DXW5_9BRAD|nr:hypothetical protein [Rhodopseudomonas rhenobacensis]